jgi:hypothetical protein
LAHTGQLLDDVKGCGLRGERPSALRKAIDACDRGLVECSAMYGIVGPAEGEGPAWVPQSWDVLEGLGTGTFNPETVSR